MLIIFLSALHNGIVGAISILLMYGIYYGGKGLIHLFRDPGSFKRLFSKKTQDSLQVKTTPPRVKGEFTDGEYWKNVYEEMKEKCNPQCFMNPYNHEKVRIANELYSELMSMGDLNEEHLRSLRHKAAKELGIIFDTKQIYDYLAAICNPSIFMDPYDAEKVNIANNFFAQIQANKNNIEQLETIRDNVQKAGMIILPKKSVCLEEEIKSPPHQKDLSFEIGQLVLIKSNENQFRISSTKNEEGTILYYSEKYNEFYSADELEDFETYWRNKNAKKSGSKKSVLPLEHLSSEKDLTNKHAEASATNVLTENHSSDNSTQDLAQKGNNEQQEIYHENTLSVGPTKPDTSNKYKLGQLVIVLANENQFKIDSIEQIGSAYWYYSEKYKRLYSESEIADSVQYWNSHK